MSHPPPPHDPNDPWAPPTQARPGGGPQAGANPYSQQTYGAPPAAYGQPGPYGYPVYGASYGSVGQPTNGKATAALWTGIGSLVLTFCCGAGIVGLVAVVLGLVARGEIRRSGGIQAGGGMAIAGIVTGAIAFVLGLVVIVVVIIAIASDPTTFDHVSQTQV
jgi:hypothetical protein